MVDKEIDKAKTLLEKLEDASNAYYDTSRGMPYDIDVTLRETAICLANLVSEIDRLKAEMKDKDALLYQQGGHIRMLELAGEEKLAEIDRLREQLAIPVAEECHEASLKEVPTIKELCEQYGLSQAGLSRKFGIPPRTVQDWYAGRKPVKDYVLRMMAAVLRYEKEL